MRRWRHDAIAGLPLRLGVHATRRRRRQCSFATIWHEPSTRQADEYLRRMTVRGYAQCDAST